MGPTQPGQPGGGVGGAPGWSLPTSAAGLAIAGAAAPALGRTDEEAIILSTRPSLLFIALCRGGWLVGVVVGAIGLDVLGEWGLPPIERSTIVLGAVLILSALLIWNTLDWWTRRYTLTTARVARESGVFTRVRREVPLRNVQSVLLTRTVRERVFSLGSIGVSSAGSNGLELSWYMVDHPERLLATLRRAIDDAGGRGTGPGGPAAPLSQPIGPAEGGPDA